MDIEMFEIKLNEIFNDEIQKIIVSNPAKKDSQYKKIDVFNKINRFMITKYTQKQAFTENIDLSEIKNFLLNATIEFKQFNFFSNSCEYMLKISNKGKILFNKNRVESLGNITKDNNRKKEYIFEEGKIIEPLVDMGIFTKDGKIIKSMFDKFKQINRFIEIIDDQIKNENYSQLNIIDFGCGKSYLTFLVYYYFKFIKNIDVHITGLDLKKDVIEKCNQTAKRYGYEDLNFELGDINGYKPERPVDIVISLHACDKATDYALYNAIKWNVKMIFSVPCCQHEVNESIKSENFPLLLKYGIVKERFSALLTDSIRCNLLKALSYNVDLMEFVDFAHTPKNLIIRAKKTNVPSKVRAKQVEEINEILKAFPCEQTFYKLLKEDNLI